MPQETPLQAFERVDGYRYQLTLTGKQAQILQDACELYERLHAGQWFALERILPIKDHDLPTFEQRMQLMIEPMLDLDKLYFERISGDIMNVIRHRLSWDRFPEGGWTVNFDKPLQFSSEPLATMERIKEQ